MIASVAYAQCHKLQALFADRPLMVHVLFKDSEDYQVEILAGYFNIRLPSEGAITQFLEIFGPKEVPQ